MNWHYDIKANRRSETVVFVAPTLAEALEVARETFKVDEPIWIRSRPCHGENCSCHKEEAA